MHAPRLALALLLACSPTGDTDAGDAGTAAPATASTSTTTADEPTGDASASTTTAATSAADTPATSEDTSTGDESTGGPAVDLSPKTYDADDPRIQYSGRVDFSDPKAPTYSAPGVYIKARFRGVGAAVRLDDQFVYDVNRNFYEVIVDDGPAQKLAPEKGVDTYVVAEGLENREHSLTFVKRTESALGWTRFKGLEISGELADPPAKPDRRMVFLGDSITCGSGNEAANNSGECYQDSYYNGGGWGQPYHNNWLSYGAVTARTLDAEYHVTAVSGICLVRNYSSLYDARTLPQVHDLMFVELQQGSPPWDPQAFVPDVVVIALGTNDFSPGDSPRPAMTVPEFTAAYVAYVHKLRADWPGAHIFAVSSPMLGDGYPSPTDQYLTDQKAALANVEAEFAGNGDAKVHKFYTTKLYGEGCGTHPSVAQHAAMADELSTFIRTTVGW